MAGKHVARIYSMFHQSGDVAQVKRIGAQLIIFLSSATDSKQRPKIRLIQT